MIRPHEYDELPELTDDMVARAVVTSGKPPMWPPDFETPAARRDVTIALDPEIADRLTMALGDGLEARVNLILRDWLDKQAA